MRRQRSLKFFSSLFTPQAKDQIINNHRSWTWSLNFFSPLQGLLRNTWCLVPWVYSCFTCSTYFILCCDFSSLLKLCLFWSQMKKEHPLETLNHCDAHDYIDLANDVALSTLSYSLEEVELVLTHPGLLAKWVSSQYKTRDRSIDDFWIPFQLKYYYRWLEIPKSIDESIEPYLGCPKLVYWHFRFFQNFQKNPSRGLNPSVIENKFSCSSYKACPCHDRFPFQKELTAKKDAFPSWSAITRKSLESTVVEHIDPHIENGISSLCMPSFPLSSW